MARKRRSELTEEQRQAHRDKDAARMKEKAFYSAEKVNRESQQGKSFYTH